MFRWKITIFLILYLFQVIHAKTLGNGTLGEDYVVFLDQNGKTHVVNLKLTTREIELIENSPDTRRIGTAKQPKFWHYTKQKINNPVQMSLPPQAGMNIDSYVPLIVVVGGWLSQHDGPATKLIKDAMLKMNKIVNVITVDWYDMQSFNYIRSAKKTLQVAQFVCDFVKHVSRSAKVDGSKIHLIGHSLGAHIAGLAGAKLKKEGITVGRVTGLDPARPFFEVPMRYPGLSKDAASFVDIIHTSASLLGIYNAVGHVSFYPGGGKNQPALCPTSCTCLGICEHSAAYKYFAKSVTQKFEARECQNYELYQSGKCDRNKVQYMGYPCDTTARGKYYLDIDNFTL